jgi:hypothetical protein
MRWTCPHCAAALDIPDSEVFQHAQRILARKGGLSVGPARAAASRANGCKGGRPRKPKAAQECAGAVTGEPGEPGEPT